MRALILAPTALALVLAGATAALADHETVDQNGIRWRWIPAQKVVEERLVTVPAHWETRCEAVSDPGRFETRQRWVWRAGGTRLETRTRTIPARIQIGPRGACVEPARTVCEWVRVEAPGKWELVSEQVFVPGSVRWVERQVWVAERCERRQFVVEREGRWVRVAEEAPPRCIPVPCPSQAEPAAPDVEIEPLLAKPRRLRVVIAGD